MSNIFPYFCSSLRSPSTVIFRKSQVAGSGSIKRWQTPGRSLPARSLKLQKTPHCGGETYCTYHLVISYHSHLSNPLRFFEGQHQLLRTICHKLSANPLVRSPLAFNVQICWSKMALLWHMSLSMPAHASPCQPWKWSSALKLLEVAESLSNR